MWRGMLGVALAAVAAAGADTVAAQSGSPAVRPETAHPGADRQRHGTFRDVSRPERPARKGRRHRLRQVFALRRRRRGLSGLDIGKC